MWDLGTGLRSSGLAANTLAHWAISLALFPTFNQCILKQTFSSFRDQYSAYLLNEQGVSLIDCPKWFWEGHVVFGQNIPEAHIHLSRLTGQLMPAPALLIFWLLSLSATGRGIVKSPAPHRDWPGFVSFLSVLESLCCVFCISCVHHFELISI